MVVFDLGETEPQFFAVRVRESKCTPNAEGQPKGSARLERGRQRGRWDGQLRVFRERGHETGRQSGGFGSGGAIIARK